jgi:hypothetical protein
VSARTVWPSEATDFTPWLGENLGFLDELGLGQLELVQVEAQLPGLGRSLDILAETADGRRVAIENQYSAVDYDHLTRGLAYAVGHDARALVVIAETGRRRHTCRRGRAQHLLTTTKQPLCGDLMIKVCLALELLPCSHPMPASCDHLDVA